MYFVSTASKLLVLTQPRLQLKGQIPMNDVRESCKQSEAVDLDRRDSRFLLMLAVVAMVIMTVQWV